MADTIPPSPLVWPPSNKFEGVDGRWSTFPINVGDSGEGLDGQNFRVLPSLYSSMTSIPGNASWCESRPNPDECHQSRGIESDGGNQSTGFMPAASSSWQNMGTYNSLLGAVFDPESVEAARLGIDTIGFSAAAATSPMLPDQVIALTTENRFMLGTFGLSDMPISIGTGSSKFSTFLRTFREAEQIPSVSYGYTAGAFYRNGESGVLGSVVLGGYDEFRLNMSSQTITTLSEASGDLIATIQSIELHYKQNQNSTEGPRIDGFSTFIDSDLPYLVFPESVCDAVAAFYNLTYDDKIGLYVTNASNTEKSMTIVMENTRVELPYGALNLPATWPLVDVDINYFPMKKSTNGRYILGRTFLQEAYLIVDYERRNFTIAQAVHSGFSGQRVVTIPSLRGTTAPPTPNTEPSRGGRKLNAGAIAGATIAAAVCIALAIVLIIRFRKRKEAQKKTISQEESWSHLKPELDGHALDRTHCDPLLHELDGSHIEEINGESLRRELEGAPVNELECTSSRSELPAEPDRCDSSSMARFRETSAGGEVSHSEP